MKTKLLFLLFIPFCAIAQSKFSFNASGGVMLIKEDSGENLELVASYKASKRICVNLSVSRKF